MVKPYCIECGLSPDELSCYKPYLEDGETATDYVKSEEGTYNVDNGHFWCDDCYVKLGMPLGVAP